MNDKTENSSRWTDLLDKTPIATHDLTGGQPSEIDRIGQIRRLFLSKIGPKGEDAGGSTKRILKIAASVPLFTLRLPNVYVLLRIQTGDLAETVLLQRLAQAYIQRQKDNPFLVEFYQGEPQDTRDYLYDNLVDVSLGSSSLAEQLVTSMRASVAVPVWLDQWLLVGPKSDLLKLQGEKWSFTTFLTALYGMLSAQDGPEFFSLSDNSASHAQECNFWSATEKLPWSEGAAKKWYKQYPDLYADDVLELAASKGAFTLTTAKTWYASSTRVRDLLTIISPGDKFQPDVMKPTCLIINSIGLNYSIGEDFFNWVRHVNGGQRIVEEFQMNGNKCFFGMHELEKLNATKPVPGSAITRAAVNLPWSANEAYFFDGKEYVRIDVPADTVYNIKQYDIKGLWPGLQDFPNGVDAVLRTGTTAEDAWFFGGDQRVHLEVESGKFISGESVKQWATVFPALKTLGCSYIDTVIPHFWSKDTPTHATFFWGSMMGVVNMANDTVVSGPEQLPAEWQGLGIHKLDAFIFVPGTNYTEGYLFSGQWYVRLDLATSEVLKLGKTEKWWTSLAKVGLFN